MGQPEVSVGDATAHADQQDVGVAGGDVDANLVVRARGDERRDRVRDRALAGLGKTGSHPDHRLLGDPDVEDPAGRRALELVEHADAEVSQHKADALILGRTSVSAAAKASLMPRPSPGRARSAPCPAAPA